MTTVKIARMAQKGASSATWITENTVLLQYEIGVETFGPGASPKLKVGDGVTAWSALPYASATTRSNTAALWTSTNPVLALGEFGFETDTNKYKIGDGVATWSVRPYANSLSSDLELIAAINAAAGGTNGDELANALSAAYGALTAPDRISFISLLLENIGANNVLRTDANGDVIGVPITNQYVIESAVFGTDENKTAKQYTFPEMVDKIEDARTRLVVAPGAGNFTLTLTDVTAEVDVAPTSNCVLTGVTGLRAGRPIPFFFTQNSAGTLTFSVSSTIKKMTSDADTVETGANAVTLFEFRLWRNGDVAIRKVGKVI